MYIHTYMHTYTGGSTVENARKYLYLILEYKGVVKSAERTFKKSVIAYKDQQVSSYYILHPTIMYTTMCPRATYDWSVKRLRTSS